jgi:outer membrane protein OmpA-like peptidoglycan-associated protein
MTGKRNVVRSGIGALVLGGLVTLGFSGCAGPTQGAMRCPYSGWSGSCTLKSLNKTRQVEFPQPHSVFEALYTAVQDPNSPNTPPDTREEFKILSKHELEWQDYMMKNGTVPCRVEQSGDGSCTDVKVALALPPFMPTGAGDVAAAPQQSGCAKLESGDPSGAPPPTPAQPSDFQPNEFFFEQNVADVNQALIQQVNSAASYLRANPNIECVGVVGQITHGESPTLANQRAVTIKNLLMGAGIEESRLTTFTATVRVYGSGGAVPDADPKERKVALRVMLGPAVAAAPSAPR